MKTKWIEMNPDEFVEARNHMPVSYLPLGTLEWHGKQLPLGSDGLQSEALFLNVAERIGGIVMPMLFLGPDRTLIEGKEEYHGMDIYRENRLVPYENQHHPGSAYWVETDVFDAMMTQTVKNLSVQKMKVLVAHGHGPSVRRVMELREQLEREYEIKIITPWDYISGELGYMTDHAASNETSIVWATYPELVDMSKLKSEKDCIGMIGKNPIEYASKELGEKILFTNVERLCTEIVKWVG